MTASTLDAAADESALEELPTSAIRSRRLASAAYSASTMEALVNDEGTTSAVWAEASPSSGIF